jgi:Holliday junction DNA helicase RuvA
MIVREDSMTLYGFTDSDTRDLFLTLLSVSGVGPRLAMATLAVHDAAALRQALHDSDVTALTRVPGIGKRGAERMVLELRDKVCPAGATGGAPAVNGHALRGPVVEALVGLGFAAKQAEEATDKVLAGDHQNGGATTSGVLRGALSLLGKAR